MIKILMIVLYVIAWPISKVLDILLGEVHITRYGRSRKKRSEAAKYLLKYLSQI